MTRSALIPVLVTGIQSTRVCAAGEAFQPKDLVWLYSCDEHRTEGRVGCVRKTAYLAFGSNPDFQALF
ncbi:hypothetical protein AGR1_13150 [Agrobacterium sp. B1(2019)]|nr:hypothetical protein AGR1_13150 [Agrobacterium sp. B1(2019)]